jgi:CMP-N-acetylneuraminic acid synthetase
VTKYICTILARGGSKSVPGKNVRLLCGKPLIAWSIEHAKAAAIFDLIVVSSDDAAILAAADAAGAELLVERPAELATDGASKLPAISHCVNAAERSLGSKADVIVDLQPTSPLRQPEDIVNVVALHAKTGAESVITGRKAKCSPYFSLVEMAADGTVYVSKKPATPLVRRQDAPVCFDMNGSIYVWTRDVFLNAPSVLYPTTRLYEMPEERSLDIDSELDFEIAKLLMRQRLSEAVTDC